MRNNAVIVSLKTGFDYQEKCDRCSTDDGGAIEFSVEKNAGEDYSVMLCRGCLQGYLDLHAKL